VGFGRRGRNDYDGIVSIVGALNVELEDVEFDGFFPSMVREVHVSRSRFRELSELDKLIERIEMRDCEIANLTQGTGIRLFQMIGGTLTSSRQVQSQIRAREISMKYVHVKTQSPRRGLAQLGFDAYAMETVQIENCTFYPNQEQGSAVMFGGELVSQPLAVTAESIAIARDEPAIEVLIRAVDIGSRIVPAETGVEGQRTSDDTFSVMALAFDLDGSLVLIGHHQTKNRNSRNVPRGVLRIRHFVCRNNVVNAGPAGFLFLRSTQTIEQQTIDLR